MLSGKGTLAKKNKNQNKETKKRPWRESSAQGKAKETTYGPQEAQEREKKVLMKSKKKKRNRKKRRGGGEGVRGGGGVGLVWLVVLGFGLGVVVGGGQKRSPKGPRHSLSVSGTDPRGKTNKLAKEP